MLMWPDCIPCIPRMCLDVARPAMSDERQLAELMDAVLQLKPLRGEDWTVTPPEVIRDVWLKIERTTGESDPLKTLKTEQNRSALEIYPSAKDLVSNSANPFLEAVKLAAAANSSDAMGDVEREAVQSIVSLLSSLVIAPQRLEGLRRRLRQAHEVVYLADNCGEIVFDKLLSEVIRDAYDPEIVFVTRTVPILNDATLEDAVAVGMDEVAQVMESGIQDPLPGTILTELPPEVGKLIEQTDLVIAKGGGNHDTLSEEEEVKGKVSFLLQAKCHPYCTIHEASLGALVVHNA